MTQFEEKFNEAKAKLPKKVINLALQIASRVINVKINLDPELINEIVQDMVTDMGNNLNEVIIKVHPDLIEHLKKAEIEKSLINKDITICPDDSINKGDCIVNTDFGGKDGTIEHKLEVLKKELVKEVSTDD